jgi:hypothetical protein
MSYEQYLAQLRRDVTRRMRVRYQFTKYVRSLFIEADDPERVADGLVDLYRSPATGERISMASRIDDAVTEIMKGEIGSPVTHRWIGSLMRTVTQLRTSSMEAPLRALVKRCASAGHGHPWLSVAAAMAHVEDTGSWCILLSCANATRDAYAALVRTPQDALRYLVSHVMVLPEDQRLERVRSTLAYVRRTEGQDLYLVAAPHLAQHRETWFLVERVRREETESQLPTRLIYLLLRDHLPLRSVRDLVRDARMVPSTTVNEPLQQLTRELVAQLSGPDAGA